MEKTEILIRDDGTLAERRVIERNLLAEDAVLEALTQQVTRPLRRALAIPEWGTYANASVGGHDTIWSVPINRLHVDARFRMTGDVLVPMFASASDPEMPLVWQCPPDIRLMFVIQTETGDNDLVNAGDHWLFAFNENGSAYRLPLPNLHDDCRVCMGDFTRSRATADQCVLASLAQFGRSRWNSDLMRTVDQSQRFFRFKPDNERFETLPVDAPDWTTLCDKVATATMERVVL